MLDPYLPLRVRLDRDAREVARRPAGLVPSGQPSFVGRVVAAPRLPTSTGLYYSVNPVAVLGPEVEGGAAALVADPTTTVLVCVLGAQAPQLGDDLVCRFVESRWVASRGRRAGGGGGGSIPGCACTSIPQALQLSASAECRGAFLSCALRYGPTPPELSGLDLGASCYLSTRAFLDPYTHTEFRYTIGCTRVFFRLSRVFLTSDAGGPYHESAIYSWTVGVPGNTCTPFLLSNGQINSGGIPSCTVTISE